MLNHMEIGVAMVKDVKVPQHNTHTNVVVTNTDVSQTTSSADATTTTVNHASSTSSMAAFTISSADDNASESSGSTATTSATAMSTSTAHASGSGQYLTSTDSAKLTGMYQLKDVGTNSMTSNGNVWIGSDGPYTNEFSNNSGESIILVVWGDKASWVNANTPYITVSMASKASITLSFANRVIGAWSTMNSSTQMVNGQISNTWGEFTMSSSYGTYDVSPGES